MQAYTQKTNHLAIRQNNSSIRGIAKTDCLATTQGGDLNRQPEW